MIKQLAILQILLLSTLSMHAQNLLKDGSFELINNSTCVSPESGFNNSVSWYPIQGSPDLFSNNCNLPEFNEVFWTKNSKASEGQNFIGLRCRVNSNQTYNSEGIAAELVEKLNPEQAYYITLKVKNKGFYQGFPSSAIDCPLTPEKKIEIYTHSDSIKVINNFANGTATSNGNLANIVTSPLLQSDIVSQDWVTVGTCFKPENNASHIAVVMPLGNFGTFPACAADDTKGTFFSFYYELDDLIIDVLPSQIEIVKYLKEGEIIDVYLTDEIELPIIGNATMLWSDGFVGSRRSLSEPGIYLIDAVFDCETVKVVLELVQEIKDFPFFIPNIFSPNDDGINDEFEVFIPNDKLILEFKLSIYDRWGNLVHESNDKNEKWNGGLSNNQFLSSEFLYFIECTIEDKSGPQKYSKSGSITIIR